METSERPWISRERRGYRPSVNLAGGDKSTREVTTYLREPPAEGVDVAFTLVAGSGIERVEMHEVAVSYSETVGTVRDKDAARRDPRWRLVEPKEDREARPWRTHRHGR